MLILFLLFLTTLSCDAPLQCYDLTDESLCSNTYRCNWHSYENKCTEKGTDYKYSPCISKQNEETCSSVQSCKWINDTCVQRNQSCSSNTNQQDCSRHYGVTYSCDWQFGKCVQVVKCSEVTDKRNCRNVYFKERCQIVIDNKASSIEKPIIFVEMFDNYQCRVQDCKYNYFGNCPKYINGRRCITTSEGCTQCNYLTNVEDCANTLLCTWQGNQCRNIFCNDFKSPALCVRNQDCHWNPLNLQCQLQTQNPLSHCFAYDITSDPVNYNLSKNIFDI